MIPRTPKELLEACRRADCCAAVLKAAGKLPQSLDNEIENFRILTAAARTELEQQLVLDWWRSEPWARPGVLEWITRDLPDGWLRSLLRYERLAPNP